MENYNNSFNSWIDKKRQYKRVNGLLNQNFWGEYESCEI